MAKTPLQELADHGQSVWIDFLSRPFVQDGDLAGLVDQGVVGVTSNPTIFQGAIAEGDAYDDQIRELSATAGDPKEIFWQLAKDDIRAACDILRPVYDEGEGLDGWVSLEVDPSLAYDAATTASEAKRLHALVDRPNVFIKIPATKEGLPAIEETIAAGIPVNVTLIFSLERHRAVAEAYLAGLQRLAESGGDLSSVASVASFFVSRVDTEADKRLDEIGGHDELKGKLAIANAKLAYRNYREIFSSPDWEALAAKGATRQRCRPLRFSGNRLGTIVEVDEARMASGGARRSSSAKIARLTSRFSGKFSCTKPPMRPASRSGLSSGEKVRDPSIGSKRAPGMILARRSPCSSGKNRSSCDQAMSAGRSQAASFSAAPIVWLESRLDSTRRRSRRTSRRVSTGNT